MSRRVQLPTDEQVRQAVEQAAADAAAGGPALSVLGVARRLNLANTTFWRNFPQTAEQIRAMTGPRAQDPSPAASTSDRNLLAEARRANADLSANLALAAANIARLTLENHQLREELAARAGVTPIDRPRTRR